ncbi:MAG TPA: glycosyltransferase family 39 protein, partial [Acidobacteriota bacterium]|nr:glycosyltransferase family 39 protein [Acidobacteriota bacterium]
MSALALLQVGMTAIAARQIGMRLMGSRWRLEPAGLQLAAETGFGLLVISYLIYGAAMIGYVLPVGGVLSPTLLWALLALLAGLALTGIPDLLGAGRTVVGALGDDRWLMLGALGALLYFAWMLMGTTLPPTSLDEMVYHLEVPAQLLRVGYLPAFTDNVLAYYPMGPQMLFAFGLGIAGDTASRMFHLLYLGLVMVALYSYTRTFVPSRSAVLGTALFMTVPTVMVIGHWAYIDMNFTLYALLAPVGTIRYVKERQDSEATALHWAVFAGLMAGAAWTIKYTALQLVLLLVLVVLVEHLRTRPREIPYGTVAIGAIAVLMFAPYLARRLIPYQIYAEANRRLGPGDRLYLVNMRTWGYLLDLPGRGEMTPFPNGWRSDYTFEHYRLERALVESVGPGDIAAYFRDQGITHLMIDEELTLSPDALAPREGRLLADFMRRYGELLYRNPRDAGQSLWHLNLAGGARP